MKQTLSREHRKILETTVAQARATAEAGAEKALKALAVGAKEAPGHASDVQKKLRAHGRALGDMLLPVSCRRQLFDLSDDMAIKLDVEFYQDAKDALLKALVD